MPAAKRDRNMLDAMRSMHVASSDLNNVQEAGDYPFRDGQITIGFAKIAVWKNNPRATFRMAQTVRSIKRLQVGRYSKDNSLPYGGLFCFVNCGIA
jgi:hypothetical protein